MKKILVWTLAIVIIGSGIGLGLHYFMKTPDYAQLRLNNLGLSLDEKSLLSSIEKEDLLALQMYEQANFKIKALSKAIPFAIENKKFQALEWLLTHGGDLNGMNEGGQSGLLLAIQSDDERLLRHLVQAGADVNFETSTKETPLLYSLKNKKTKMVRLLLELKADLNKANSDGLTPLFAALAVGDRDLLGSLLAGPVNLEQRNKEGLTALLWCINERKVELALPLIEKGADLNAAALISFNETQEWNSPADLAFLRELPDLSEILSNRGAKKTVSDFIHAARADAHKLNRLIQLQNDFAPIHGIISEEKSWSEYPELAQNVKTAGLPFDQLLAIVIDQTPALLITTDTHFGNTGDFKTRGKQWTSHNTPEGPLPVFVESKEKGLLSQTIQELKKNLNVYLMADMKQHLSQTYDTAMELRQEGLTLLETKNLIPLVYLLKANYLPPLMLETAKTAALCPLAKANSLSKESWMELAPQLQGALTKRGQLSAAIPQPEKSRLIADPAASPLPTGEPTERTPSAVNTTGSEQNLGGLMQLCQSESSYASPKKYSTLKDCACDGGIAPPWSESDAKKLQAHISSQIKKQL